MEKACVQQNIILTVLQFTSLESLLNLLQRNTLLIISETFPELGRILPNFSARFPSVTDVHFPALPNKRVAALLLLGSSVALVFNAQQLLLLSINEAALLFWATAAATQLLLLSGLQRLYPPPVRSWFILIRLSAVYQLLVFLGFLKKQ